MKSLIVYCNSMVDGQLIDEQALQALLLRMQSGPAALSSDPADPPTGTPSPTMTLRQAVTEILAGNLLLLVEGRTGAVVFRLERKLGRGITEPVVEGTIRGPREGFVEDPEANITLIRRRLQTPSFRLEWMRVGEQTTTPIALLYLDGVADPRVVRRARLRVRRIRIDAVLDSGYVEELIEDAPYSPFPTVAHTERPDRVAAGLLEGQVALVTSGSPQVLLVPTVLVQLLHSPEDYYERYMIGTATRVLRLLGAFLALTLPSFYVAVTTYHHEMIPAPLFQAIAAQREGVPWPAVMEAFLMEIAFELLREAGIRLPRPVGQAVSIIGGLVIGEAAIRARIASAGMIIIVATTGIASYAVPAYNLSVSLRLIRFPLMLMAAVLGLHGVVVGLLLLLIHLLSLRSFGVPYLSPIMPPKPQHWGDVIFRAPWWKMGGRQ
jgi:spore germination protein KA